MQIIVQTLSFGAICLGVKASDTIDDIKKALRRHIDTLYTGYDVELIYGAESVARWTFNGVTLDGYRSASWYDIAEGGTIRSTFSLPGGAPQKRPRVTMADLQPKGEDIEQVRACFSVAFDKTAFLEEMRTNRRDTLVEYKTRCDGGRSVEQIANITMDYLPEFMALKDYFMKYEIMGC
jgi:hypothetical protein